MAGVASSQRLDRDGLLCTGERFFKRQFEVVAEIRAARRAGSLRPRVHELAEDRREDVGKALKPAAGTAERALAVHPVLEGGVPEAVIGRSLLRVLEDVIGLVNGLELRLMLLAAALAVGMALFGQPAIRSLDCRIVGAPRDAEHVIIIRGHQSPPMTSGADRISSAGAVVVMAS